MKVFDHYINAQPITIRGTYGCVVAVIPSGTRGCIIREPTKKYPDPFFEVIYAETWYSMCVKKDILVRQKNNAEVQRLMALCPLIQHCLDQTKHNIRPEVSAVQNALAHFLGRVHSLRFLPPVEMDQAMRSIRQDRTFQNRFEQQYGGKEDDRSRTTYEVSLGHYEYLLRTLDQFLATGLLKEQLCWFVMSHEEGVMRDKTTPCTETAIQMVCRVAQEQAAILVAQEKRNACPYPFLYAAYIISELIHYNLSQAWYSYRDILYSEQERIAKESLIAAGYHNIVA